MKASRYILFSFLAVVVTLSAAAQINDTYVVPAAGNTPGAFGTRWMTRLSLFNPQAHDLNVSVTFLPTNGGTGKEKLIPVPANSVTLYDNVLQEVYGLSGITGALLVGTFPEDNPGVADDIISRAFLVETETYNNSSSGTFGQTIPGVWAGLQDFSSDGISAIAHGIRNVAKQGWRANVGAVNLGRSNVTLLVSVYDIDGHTLLSKQPMDLPPFAHKQASLPVEVDRGSVEFFLDDPSHQAVVFPYVSVIDQYSGDPAYHSPTLLASPSILFNASAKTALTPASLASPGKKIDLAYAREVRAHAERLGVVAGPPKP
jgi:hypothetical protein